MTFQTVEHENIGEDIPVSKTFSEAYVEKVLSDAEMLRRHSHTPEDDEAAVAAALFASFLS